MGVNSFLRSSYVFYLISFLRLSRITVYCLFQRYLFHPDFLFQKEMWLQERSLCSSSKIMSSWSSVLITDAWTEHLPKSLSFAVKWVVSFISELWPYYFVKIRPNRDALERVFSTSNKAEDRTVRSKQEEEEEHRWRYRERWGQKQQQRLCSDLVFICWLCFCGGFWWTGKSLPSHWISSDGPSDANEMILC